MLEISLDKMLEKAKEYAAGNIPWHYHSLPRNCIYNHVSQKYQLILENEDDGACFVALSVDRPQKWQNQLKELQSKTK
jgi:hypothetical protein